MEKVDEPRTVHVPAEVLQAIVERAREAAPAECCGALLGVSGRDGAEVHVGAAMPLPNREPASDRYSVDPESVRTAEVEAARVGFEVVGFYHSHPAGGARPSRTDLELAWPWYVYLVADAGVESPARVWRLAEDRSSFLEERLVVEGGT